MPDNILGSVRGRTDGYGEVDAFLISLIANTTYRFGLVGGDHARFLDILPGSVAVGSPINYDGFVFQARPPESYSITTSISPNVTGDHVVRVKSYALTSAPYTLIVVGGPDAPGMTGDFAALLPGNGTPDGDLLTGGAGNDGLMGLSGQDTLQGGAGDDILDGGAGQDLLDGGAGNDAMAGGPGDDTYIVTEPGDLTLEAADGGTDTVWLALSNWTLPADVEVVRLYGQAFFFWGSGTLIANQLRGSDLVGQAGDDTLWGSIYADTLSGGAGRDTFHGQGGFDMLNGGAGDDTYLLTATGATITEYINEGVDTAWASANGITMSEGVKWGRLCGAATRLDGGRGFDNLVANSELGSTLNGNEGNDILWGSRFADTLNGGAQSDTLRGQGGADLLVGGTGNDTYSVTDNLATIVENAGGGTDTAWYAVNGMLLAANVERAYLSGAANSLAGNDQANLLVGNPLMGNAYLAGGAGNDTMYGGAFDDLFRGDAGNDVLYSGGGADVFVIQGPGFGYDQINGFVQGAASIDFRGSGIGFSDLFLNSAGGNTQVEVFGSAILVFGVAQMSVADFLF